MEVNLITIINNIECLNKKHYLINMKFQSFEKILSSTDKIGCGPHLCVCRIAGNCWRKVCNSQFLFCSKETQRAKTVTALQKIQRLPDYCYCLSSANGLQIVFDYANGFELNGEDAAFSQHYYISIFDHYV